MFCRLFASIRVVLVMIAFLAGLAGGLSHPAMMAQGAAGMLVKSHAELGDKKTIGGTESCAGAHCGVQSSTCCIGGQCVFGVAASATSASAEMHSFAAPPLPTAELTGAPPLPPFRPPILT